MRRGEKTGFTLIELMVVVLIISVVLAVIGTAARRWTHEAAVERAAADLHAELEAARSRAQLEQVAGVRLLVDETYPLVRTDDGRIDPSAPLAWGRVAPLVLAPDHREGRVVAPTGPYPDGFAPPAPCLVLEEALYLGVERQTPTSWWWTIRVGDVLEVHGGRYTVVGPVVQGPADGNPELYCNWGPLGTASPLDRGDGPREFLYLVNGLDDDRDGLMDEGRNGLDDDLDGYVDEPDEWEVERWTATRPETPSRYRIARRPRVDMGRSWPLASGAVIDAGRSTLPIDPWTGTADVLLDRDGAVTLGSRSYAPHALPLRAWIGDRADVAAETPAWASATVTIEPITGKIVAEAGE